MSQILTEESRALVDNFLYQYTEADRHKLIEQLVAAPDKEGVALYLCDHVAGESHHWRRTWCITALAALNTPAALKTVIERLDVTTEPFEWARYWAAVGVAKMMSLPQQQAELKGYLVKLAAGDPSISVTAVALRLLVEKGWDEEYLQPLVDMLESKDWDRRQAACKALRREAALKPHPAFSARLEQRLIQKLTQVLHDRSELADVRYQAAQAMKSMGQRQPEIVASLSEALRKNMPDLARRTCVEALAGLNTPDVKEALLFALEDDDAEIRQRAAKALKKTLAAKTLAATTGSDALGAVEFIIEHLLREDLLAQDEIARRRYAKYIEALREIDDKEAAKVLSGYLFDPNPAIVDRASRALTELGGEAALRTLQAQRTQAVEKYTELLGKADQAIMEQYENLMRQARLAYRVSMVMHGATFAIGVLLLLASLYLALNREPKDYWQTILGTGVGGGVVTLLTLFYKDPFKNIGRSVNRLIKVNVVFLGYVRQINQIDATFKHLFLDADGFTIGQMKDTVKQIQIAVDQTMEKIKLYLLEEGEITAERQTQ